MADARDKPGSEPVEPVLSAPESVYNDRSSSAIVASDDIVQVSVTNQVPGVSAASPEDDRKKRCVDRYDSSESSDSGVAVLSGTESGGSGCSGSELTEPDSPASPASSPGPPRPPPWSLPARTHHPGTITNYFHHKMKTPNPLKRDHSWSRADEPSKKCKVAGGGSNIEDYISLLKDTLKPKVLLEAPKKKSKAKPKAAAAGADVRPKPSPPPPRPRIVPVYTEPTDKVNGATYGSNNMYLNSACKTSAPKRRPAGVLPPGTRKTTWYRLEGNVAPASVNAAKQTPREQAISAALASLPVDKGAVHFADTAPKMTVAGAGGAYPLGFTGSVGVAAATSSSLAPYITVPQVMLTALRIPQPASRSQQVNAPGGVSVSGINGVSNLNGFSRQNVAIGSPTELNGGFVFPLVQNLNGTVVQIPNLMTEASHNYVLPHSTHIQQLQPQRADGGMQQQGQVLINGTLLKLTSSLAPNYSGGASKPTTTYPLVNKALNTALPTVMTPKLHYMNVGHHSVLMPQPGYFINPVPSNTSKENYANVGAQSHLTNVYTSCTFSTPQPSPALQGLSHCNQVSHTSSITIPPVKPPDKRDDTVLPPTMTPVRLPAITPVVLPPISPETVPKLTSLPPRLPENLLKRTVTLEQKKLNVCNYPNLTELLNRPFAQVCKSTEKMLDIAADECSRPESDKEPASPGSPAEETKDELVAADSPQSDESVFAQLAAMELVSSEVREATLSCVTNESSESGIGTDKSIDSPGTDKSLDSPGAGKDDDDSRSLSVSVCSLEAEPCQKSPLLKQPKVLRFPPMSAEQKLSEQRPKGRRRPSSVTACRWESCRDNFDTDTDLLEHLQTAHVNGQAGRENYVCLWTGCKVRGKPSCSRLWLERHALSHAGNKPFKCIVDDCERRFSTQTLLERHVNNHFDEQTGAVGGARKSADSGPRLIRRNGKVLRYRRQPWSARMFDYFDGGMMEGLAWRLARVSSWRAHTARFTCMPPAHQLTLVAALAATRYNALTDTREALVVYSPPHVLEDEWIPERDVRRVRCVDMAQLPAHTKVLLHELFCEAYGPPPPPAAGAAVRALAAAPAPAPDATCESSRMLNNLLAKQKKADGGLPNGCRRSDGAPPERWERGERAAAADVRREVSGAAKRKQGRRYGGSAFWPCGR